MPRTFLLLLLLSSFAAAAFGFAPLAQLPPTRIVSINTIVRPALLDSAVVGELASSLFRSQGQVPLLQSFGLQAFLFAALSNKLSSMLTPTGFANSFVLGTLLWNTLGWKGWSVCVVYLFLGQAVTKVRFAEKEKKGIAEKRGGRRGPENVW